MMSSTASRGHVSNPFLGFPKSGRQSRISLAGPRTKFADSRALEDPGRCRLAKDEKARTVLPDLERSVGPPGDLNGVPEETEHTA